MFMLPTVRTGETVSRLRARTACLPGWPGRPGMVELPARQRSARSVTVLLLRSSEVRAGRWRDTAATTASCTNKLVYCTFTLFKYH